MRPKALALATIGGVFLVVLFFASIAILMDSDIGRTLLDNAWTTVEEVEAHSVRCEHGGCDA